MTIEMTVLQAVLAAIGVFIAGIALRITTDFISAGRIEKTAPYVTTIACEVHREKCCVGTIKKEVASIETRVSATEKRLDDGRKDFQMLRTAIGSMQSDISGMKALLKQALNRKT